MQMKPLGVKLCCLIGHMTTMGVASLCLSLPSGDHPEGIQKYLIPIYQVGNQWLNHTMKWSFSEQAVVFEGGNCYQHISLTINIIFLHCILASTAL